MFVFITIVHVLLSIFMIFVILLQPGKDAGMGSTLGGGAATTAFGGRGGATFLTKLTAFCAVSFFLTSWGLSFEGLQPSLIDSIPSEAATAPETPSSGGPSGQAPAAVEKASPAQAEPKPPPVEPSPKPTDSVPAEKL